MHVYFHHVLDPALNLALEEGLLSEGEECFLLWRNSPSVIIGRHQDAAAEIDLEVAKQRNIPFFRRMSGGGAVYHDLGNINLSWIGDVTEPVWTPIFQIFSTLGIKPQTVAPNDLQWNGRKISGMAVFRSGSVVLRHASLLFGVDLETMSHLLTPSAAKLNRHCVSSVAARVGNLAEQTATTWRAEEFMTGCVKSAAAFFGGPPKAITAAQWERADRLATQKYRSEKWNRYGVI